jgi:cytochrome P450
METTASSLMWTFLFFLHHPDVQEKVHKELDEVNNKKIMCDLILKVDRRMQNIIQTSKS